MASQCTTDGKGACADRSSRTARLLAVRRVAVDRAALLREAGEQVAADRARVLVEAFGADRAEVLLAGATNERGLEASKRRDLVERMSREGSTVREIASAAQLSYGHVVDLRAQLGVGRKR